jgi:hypothetical protein
MDDSTPKGWLPDKTGQAFGELLKMTDSSGNPASRPGRPSLWLSEQQRRAGPLARLYDA